MTHKKGTPQRLSQQPFFRGVFVFLIVVAIGASIVGIASLLVGDASFEKRGDAGGTFEEPSSDDRYLTLPKGARQGEPVVVDLDAERRYLRIDKDPTVSVRVDVDPPDGYTYLRIDGLKVPVKPGGEEPKVGEMRFWPFRIIGERKGQKATIVLYR